jgi:hypothetical protein
MSQIYSSSANLKARNNKIGHLLDLGETFSIFFKIQLLLLQDLRRAGDIAF